MEGKKHMEKHAILVVSFGTSYEEAKKNSLDQILMEVKAAYPETPVFEAYTSGIIRKKWSQAGKTVWSVKEAMEHLKQQGFQRVSILSTHMIPGIEYQKLCQEIREYASAFRDIRITRSVLEETKDCEQMVQLIDKILQVEPGKEYILMGHGTEHDANIRYEQMNRAFEQAGYENVRIASVEGEPGIEEVMERMQNKNTTKCVVLHPFMVVAGDHAHNDMAGEEDSFKSMLEEKGYRTEPILKGLGEYAVFRQMYLEKLGEIVK